MKKGRNKYRNDNNNEEFYYACICDLLNGHSNLHSKAHRSQVFQSKNTRIFVLSVRWSTSETGDLGMHQLTTAILWYLWIDEIFRVPICTLQLPAWEGGMELLDTHAKWITLYHTRSLKQTETLCAITAEVLATWKHFLTTDIPPNLRVTARELEYIRIFREWY